jgi:hypothetical protein
MNPRLRRVLLSAARVYAYSVLGALIASGIFDEPAVDDAGVALKLAYAGIPAALSVLVNALEPDTSPVKP